MMNPFFFVILIALLVEYSFEVIANLLNVRSLSAELPPDLEGVYEPEEYRKSQEYLRANTRLHFVTSTVSLVVLLSFWFAGGFNYLDQALRSWAFVPILNGLLYIGILATGYRLISLPFSIYHTFVIEERFGFNRATRRTFAADKIKDLGLTALIGAPLLSGILALFEYAGYYA